MPTSATNTYSINRVDPLKNAEDASIENVNLVASTTYAAGTVIGAVAATPGTYGTYASGNTDGTQNPTHILQYQVTTDASGNVFLGAAASSEWGQSVGKGAPAYRSGYFSCADLTGLDANAVTKLGRLEAGTVSAGRFQMYG